MCPANMGPIAPPMVLPAKGTLLIEFLGSVPNLVREGRTLIISNREQSQENYHEGFLDVFQGCA